RLGERAKLSGDVGFARLEAREEVGAASKVRVEAAGGVRVVALDGFAQRGGGHADLYRQRIDRGRTEQPVRIRIVRAKRTDLSAVPPPGVKDQVARQAREGVGARIELAHRSTQIAFVHRLVDEAVATAIDDDATGKGWFGHQLVVELHAVDR